MSLYAILGVDPSADAEAIKRAYYRVCLYVCPCMEEIVTTSFPPPITND